jgi:hypothetical protein
VAGFGISLLDIMPPRVMTIRDPSRKQAAEEAVKAKVR